MAEGRREGSDANQGGGEAIGFWHETTHDARTQGERGRGRSSARWDGVRRRVASHSSDGEPVEVRMLQLKQGVAGGSLNFFPKANGSGERAGQQTAERALRPPNAKGKKTTQDLGIVLDACVLSLEDQLGRPIRSFSTQLNLCIVETAF